ncbi:protein kinase domain-containing protein [Sorangium sp. So ce1078]|uniref:protein kinase domain-containing protein n=1 Tax=Sorangium sp. So ce1078 TaxID=3133329 RepID=UPI003F6423C5
MSEAEEEEILRLKARVGTTLDGKWRLDGLIGAGGMAAVYAATHHVGHRVAIKILHPEGAVSRELRARFEQEALAAARLGHPAAVQVLDIDVTEQGEPFLVMELLEGESLRERALRLGSVPLPELLAHVDTLLEVLRAAHDAGIVHRDIKPDNLFVTRDGRLKVLDFGIARMKQGGAGLKTRTGAVLGTTSYMAPEQILGRNVDGRADLYAVGATMFTLLANRRLHDADALTEGELLVKMSTTPAPPLATVAPGVDPRVARVVDRALAFHVERRYPDAQTMLADVRAVRRGEEPPFATAGTAESDERTRAHGRATPGGPPGGAPPPGAGSPAMFPGAGSPAPFPGAGSPAPFPGAGSPAMFPGASPPAMFPGAGPPAMAVPPAPAVSTAPLSSRRHPAAGPAPGPRAPGSPQLAVVGVVAVLLFCVGLGAVLLLWPSRDQGAREGGAPTAVALKDIAQAQSSVAPAVSANSCAPGVPCTCGGGSPGNAPKSCQLTCGEASGCRPSCSDREVCESRCAGDCQSSCARSKACDTRCTDNCSVDCRNADTCQVTCGVGCSYTCEDVEKCVPVVGDGSVVRCNRVGGCEVTCTGSCAVSCSNTGGGCPVTCQGQGPAVKCRDGRKACGGGCSLPR